MKLKSGVSTDEIPCSRSHQALIAVIALVALASGLMMAAAQSTTKPGTEIWTAPGRAARKENPVASDAKSVAQGKDLFIVGCLPCHGTGGKGDGPAAATLQRDGVAIRPGDLSNPKLSEQSDGALFWKVSEGRTPMPAFQEAFSEEQRWQIINYVRTLATQQGNTKPADKK